MEIFAVNFAYGVTFKNLFQARLQQYGNHELADVQAGFRKGRETRYQIVNIRWIIEKALTIRKLLTVWITTDCGKF